MTSCCRHNCCTTAQLLQSVQHNCCSYCSLYSTKVWRTLSCTTRCRVNAQTHKIILVILHREFFFRKYVNSKWIIWKLICNNMEIYLFRKWQVEFCQDFFFYYKMHIKRKTARTCQFNYLENGKWWKHVMKILQHHRRLPRDWHVDL